MKADSFTVGEEWGEEGGREGGRNGGEEGNGKRKDTTRGKCRTYVQRDCCEGELITCTCKVCLWKVLCYS